MAILLALTIVLSFAVTAFAQTEQAGSPPSGSPPGGSAPEGTPPGDPPNGDSFPGNPPDGNPPDGAPGGSAASVNYSGATTINSGESQSPSADDKPTKWFRHFPMRGKNISHDYLCRRNSMLQIHWNIRTHKPPDQLEIVWPLKAVRGFEFLALRQEVPEVLVYKGFRGFFISENPADFRQLFIRFLLQVDRKSTTYLSAIPKLWTTESITKARIITIRALLFVYISRLMWGVPLSPCRGYNKITIPGAEDNSKASGIFFFIALKTGILKNSAKIPAKVRPCSFMRQGLLFYIS